MNNKYQLRCLLLRVSLAAQTNNQTPCAAPEAHQFDFWLGDWKATYSDSIHPINHIEMIMDGCTVQENFSDPSQHYLGKS